MLSKNVGQKSLSKMIFVCFKKIWVKKLGSKKNLDQKKFLGQKTIWVKKKFWVKKILSEIFLG